MKAKNNILTYVALVGASAIFLVIEHLTHIEFMLHYTPRPLPPPPNPTGLFFPTQARPRAI